MYKKAVLLLFLFSSILVADQTPSPSTAKPVSEEYDTSKSPFDCVSAQHSFKLGHKILSYESCTGTLKIKKDDKEAAKIFFTAYFLQGAEPSKDRPITFCFNGGPGSSAIWLHMGCLGPKRVVFQDLAFNPSPGRYQDNEYTLLDASDLVFVDPVSTGFSQPEKDVDGSTFYSVEEDIASIAEFIRCFLTAKDRMSSPKYLLGESYGTIRIVGLANKLNNDYFLSMNGLMLVSSCLDMKTLQIGYASDLSYALTLPSYAATAHFHKMLSPELQKKGLQELLAEVEDFAANDYTLALFQGTLLAPERMKEISQRIASYTGLSEHYVEKANLRIDSMRYFKELMRKDGRIVGRFDSRFVIPAGDLVDDITILDPTIISMGGCYASAFLQYLRDDLQWKANAPYYIVNDKISSEWNWTTKSAPAGLGYLNFTDELTQAVVKNPALGVLFANGYYDLATPYMTADYTVAHMIELPASLRNNIEQHYYHAGHMMYVNEPSLAQLKRDLSSFIEKRNGSAFHGIPDTATQVSDLPQSDLPLLSPLQKAEEEMEATSAH